MSYKGGISLCEKYMYDPHRAKKSRSSTSVSALTTVSLYLYLTLILPHSREPRSRNANAEALQESKVSRGTTRMGLTPVLRADLQLVPQHNQLLRYRSRLKCPPPLFRARRLPRHFRDRIVPLQTPSELMLSRSSYKLLRYGTDGITSLQSRCLALHHSAQSRHMLAVHVHRRSTLWAVLLP